jgi:hypothetical protein
MSSIHRFHFDVPGSPRTRLNQLKDFLADISSAHWRKLHQLRQHQAVATIFRTLDDIFRPLSDALVIAARSGRMQSRPRSAMTRCPYPLNKHLGRVADHFAMIAHRQAEFSPLDFSANESWLHQVQRDLNLCTHMRGAEE